MTEILRYAAFTTDPDGGNPAGVVLDARALDEGQMQAIAAEVGYSETAFLDPDTQAVRYFSPLAEVPFCGHATIATAVAWAERHGPGRLELRTQSGLVPVEVGDAGGRPAATLTSVEPRSEAVDPGMLAEALAALRWGQVALDPAIPPRIAYAGARHLVLATAEPGPLAALDYDFDRLAALMAPLELITLQLVHRVDPVTFRARDPFPPGGVVEDPATGAAAAALGGYLRELRVVKPPAEVVIHQGAEIGRPSELRVGIPERGGIRVTGHAVRIA